MEFVKNIVKRVTKDTKSVKKSDVQSFIQSAKVADISEKKFHPLRLSLIERNSKEVISSLDLTNSFTCETYNKKSCLYRQKKQAERIFCLLCYNDLKVVK